jgi:hypothetical protein
MNTTECTLRPVSCARAARLPLILSEHFGCLQGVLVFHSHQAASRLARFVWNLALNVHPSPAGNPHVVKTQDIQLIPWYLPQIPLNIGFKQNLRRYSCGKRRFETTTGSVYSQGPLLIKLPAPPSLTYRISKQVRSISRRLPRNNPPGFHSYWGLLQ